MTDSPLVRVLPGPAVGSSMARDDRGLVVGCVDRRVVLVKVCF